MNRTNNEYLNVIDPDNNVETNVDSCKYFTVSEFNSFSGCDAGNYLLLNQNIQSFEAKKSMFEAFLGSIPCPFHTIVLTETWLEEKYLDLCKIDHFNAVHTYRTERRGQRGGIGGGISLFAISSVYEISKIDVYPFVILQLKPVLQRYGERTMLMMSILLWGFTDHILIMK